MKQNIIKKLILLVIVGFSASQTICHVGFNVGFGVGHHHRCGWGYPCYHDDGAAVAASGIIGLAAGAAIASAAKPEDPALELQRYKDRQMLLEEREKDRELLREEKARNRELKRKEKEEQRKQREEALAQKRYERKKSKQQREQETTELNNAAK